MFGISDSRSKIYLRRCTPPDSIRPVRKSNPARSNLLPSICASCALFFAFLPSGLQYTDKTTHLQFMNGDCITVSTMAVRWHLQSAVSGTLDNNSTRTGLVFRRIPVLVSRYKAGVWWTGEQKQLLFRHFRDGSTYAVPALVSGRTWCRTRRFFRQTDLSFSPLLHASSHLANPELHPVFFFPNSFL